MSQSAEAWLTELTSLYTPYPGEFDEARSHRASIQARLDYAIGVREMFEIGSLRHGTGIWRFSDVDFLVSLKGLQPSSPWTMLTKVTVALQERFPSTTIGVRRPAVVCKFSDGDVEVVPGYEDGAGYMIASPLGDWMKTYPKDHNKYVNEINRKHNGGAKTLARQVKMWKYLRDVPVSSCYLEMRAAKHLDGESSYVALWDLYLALKKMRDTNLAALNDPTGLSSRFTACSSDATKATALSKVRAAVIRADRAKDYARQGYHVLAIDQLKLLFNR